MNKDELVEETLNLPNEISIEDKKKINAALEDSLNLPEQIKEEKSAIINFKITTFYSNDIYLLYDKETKWLYKEDLSPMGFSLVNNYNDGLKIKAFDELIKELKVSSTWEDGINKIMSKNNQYQLGRLYYIDNSGTVNQIRELSDFNKAKGTLS